MAPYCLHLSMDTVASLVQAENLTSVLDNYHRLQSQLIRVAFSNLTERLASEHCLL